MRAVIQRVTEAECVVEGKSTGRIEKGYVCFLGVGRSDSEKEADKLLEKILKLRIFSDENDKINLSLDKVSGGILIISQFTLYAGLKGCNRPGFTEAAPPSDAERLYDYFVGKCAERVARTETGIFGADMKISLLNDGPFTICLDTDSF